LSTKPTEDASMRSESRRNPMGRSVSALAAATLLVLAGAGHWIGCESAPQVEHAEVVYFYVPG
jgi:hypothetical protein